jgi:DNA-directed RNA polymerase sigma subunit (sigma70/sigma32)
MEIEKLNSILKKNLERLFIVECIYWPLFKEINPKYLMLSVSLEHLISNAEASGCEISRTKRLDPEIDNKEVEYKDNEIRRIRINKQQSNYNTIYTNDEVITLNVPQAVLDSYHIKVSNCDNVSISNSSKELEILLSKIKQQDQNAFQELIEIYFPTILKIAKEHIDFEIDALQEGLNGFSRSCSIYDATKDGQFVDYANKWIRSFIDQAIAETRRLT